MKNLRLYCNNWQVLPIAPPPTPSPNPPRLIKAACFSRVFVLPLGLVLTDLRTCACSARSNGLLDPWTAGGVVRNVSDSVKAVLIPEGAHHLDLRAQNPADPVSVRGARKLHRQYIRRWIKEHWASLASASSLAATLPDTHDDDDDARDNRLLQQQHAVEAADIQEQDSI